MNASATEQTERTQYLLLDHLKQKQAPMSLQELETNLKSELILSHRTVKEAAWKLVEEGKAQFTASWDLELKC